MSSRKVAACKHRELDKKLRCKACGVLVDIRAKKNKYGNRKVFLDGMWFDSVKESRRYQALMADPMVCNLRCQEGYPLMVNGLLICTYRADFVYMRGTPGTSQLRGVVEDAKPKGKKFKTTPAYRMFVIKKKLMKACHNIDVQEI